MMTRTLLLSSTLVLAGCPMDEPGGMDTDMDTDDTGGVSYDDRAFSPSSDQTMAVGDTVTLTATGLDDSVAYRATLVIGANLTWSGDEAVFVDNDANGAADAGNSTEHVTITTIQGDAVDHLKTFPAGTDDPANPSGIFPTNGEIAVELTGVGAGTAYLVVYENGGDSTFLELDGDGLATETHLVSGKLTVSSDGMPDVTPTLGRTAGATDVVSYAIVDLDDSTAYRVTLVVSENVTLGTSGATFLDADMSGTADAGASEARALISAVNGSAITAAKTFPAGTDDPMAPSGINPVDGRITLDVTGVAAGSIVPVAYENGGDSTFLEVDTDGVPTEAYGVGGMLTIE